jgi:hypothetical protein
VSYHRADYIAAGREVMMYVNTKPGLLAIGCLIGMIIGRLAA